MATDTPQSDRSVIGWREWVGLPDLGIKHIKAKIDTGARSSSIYATDIEFFESDGIEMVRFCVHPRQRDTDFEITVEAPLAEHRAVKSSTGHESVRPVVVTMVRIGEQVWPIELTLAKRDMMGFRMLLGRQALRGRYVVDPARSYVLGKRKKRRKKRKKRRSS